MEMSRSMRVEKEIIEYDLYMNGWHVLHWCVD